LILLAVPALVFFPAGPARAQEPADSLLVILAETGKTHDGLPVLRHAPDPAPVARLLGRGFAGRMLRLYREEQQFLHERDGRPVRPAYLLLSGHEGGYGRRGFVLDGTAMPETGYVDLPAGSARSGRFGALDQLFPHELLHVIVEQLAGPPPAYRSSQVHEVASQTDRVYAFQEGLAEAMQILAVDDPDADPATRTLTGPAGADRRRWVAANLAEYRSVLAAPLQLAPPIRLSFALWYSQAAQVQRYFSVRRNEFAYQPDIPRRLLRPGDSYPAYLLDNVLPGTPGVRPKPATRLVATEGVVSHLMWRWLTDPAVQRQYADDAFYARFGTTRAGVDGLDNAMLKLFQVLSDRKPADVGALVDAYRARFPADADPVDRVRAEALVGQALPVALELWLTNPQFTVGASVLDQYRALPRPHVFDLNAAGTADLLAVPGVDVRLAGAILARAPYRQVDDLSAVPGMTPRVLDELRAMATAPRGAPNAAEENIDIGRILLAYLLRAFAFLAATAAGAAVLQRLVRRIRWRRAVPVGTVAAVLGTVPAWLRPAIPGLTTAACLLLPLGAAVAATLLDLRRHRDPRHALRVAAGWLAALLPAALVTQPWS
jgi:hypothetical protein